jgi:hypothetical protein
MTKIDSVESRVESYLDRVRTALHGLPERQIDDIMRELRAHAIELAEGRGVEAALASLGDPVDLAKGYRAESQMVRAECSSSSLRILLGLRHAGRTRAGRFAATVLYAFGYIYVVTLWLVAADKLLFPSRTGLWYVPGDWKSIALRTTDGSPPPGAHDLLGWWLIPAAILAGWILRYLIDSVAQWWLRRYRQSEGGSHLVKRAN